MAYSNTGITSRCHKSRTCVACRVAQLPDNGVVLRLQWRVACLIAASVYPGLGLEMAGVASIAWTDSLCSM